MGAFKRRPSPYGEGPTSVARANVPVLQVLLTLSVGLHTGYCPAWKGVRKAKWSGRGLRFNLGKHSADPNPNHHLAWAGLRRMNGPRHSWGGFTVLGDPMFKGDRQTRDYPSGLADSGFPSNWLGFGTLSAKGTPSNPRIQTRSGQNTFCTLKRGEPNCDGLPPDQRRGPRLGGVWNVCTHNTNVVRTLPGPPS